MPRSRRQAEPCADEAPPQPARLLTGAELRVRLACSPSAYKRLLGRGMPWMVDLAIQQPGKKRHRSLRFDLQQVLGWLRARSAV